MAAAAEEARQAEVAKEQAAVQRRVAALVRQQGYDSYISSYVAYQRATQANYRQETDWLGYTGCNPACMAYLACVQRKVPPRVRWQAVWGVEPVVLPRVTSDDPLPPYQPVTFLTVDEQHVMLEACRATIIERVGQVPADWPGRAGAPPDVDTLAPPLSPPLSPAVQDPPAAVQSSVALATMAPPPAAGTITMLPPAFRSPPPAVHWAQKQGYPEPQPATSCSTVAATVPNPQAGGPSTGLRRPRSTEVGGSGRPQQQPPVSGTMGSLGSGPPSASLSGGGSGDEAPPSKAPKICTHGEAPSADEGCNKLVNPAGISGRHMVLEGGGKVGVTACLGYKQIKGINNAKHRQFLIVLVGGERRWCEYQQVMHLVVFADWCKTTVPTTCPVGWAVAKTHPIINAKYRLMSKRQNTIWAQCSAFPKPDPSLI